jgi:D-tyrosyl-tRNA(Tyr) deacylase
MRAVVQRVTRAQVTVAGEVIGAIEHGLCVLVGAANGDAEADATQLADKIVNLRIFSDTDGKMNQSLLDCQGGVLAVSQFTLLGDARKGRRPGFTDALEPVAAEKLYQFFVGELKKLGVSRVETGKFRADMQVELVNDGPVTILLDSKKLF